MLRFDSLLAVLVTATVACAACKQGPVDKPGTATATASGASAASSKAGETTTIIGAGATFPYPIYARWGHSYNKDTGVQLNYQSIGSGGGIKQIKARTVDFGASDAPMKPEELAAAGLVQFPMILGGVVPAVNLKGLADKALALDGPTLAAIYLGEIKLWNDPRIAGQNPGVALPATQITPVYRADGSGTTWVFTNYLSKVSPGWKEKAGFNTTVSWPVGVGGKGNEGVAAYVQRVEGSIGYVEYAYALQNKLAVARMKNADGQVVEPGVESFQAAAASADWKNAPGFYLVLTEQAGAKTWPISGASFILMHKVQPDRAKAEVMLNFFDYAYRAGDDAAVELHYVPMPDAVVAVVQEAWAREFTADGKPVWPANVAGK